MSLVSQQRVKGLGAVAGSLIKRILVGSLAACGLLLVASSARANDMYFAQNASGSANGTDCADAFGLHDASHGINVSGNWVPGNTLHICGSISLAANTNAVTAQASGMSGSPITIKFESGAVLASPYWPGNPSMSCASNCGAIDTNSKSYITIDGGGTGVIEGTANGSSLSNHQPSMGVFLRGNFLMLKNLTIKNIYLNSSAESTSQWGFGTADVLIGGSNNNVEVCNNTLNNAHVGIWSAATQLVFVPAPSQACTGTQAAAGVNLYNNTLSDHGWQMNIGGTGYVNIYSNDISNFANWFYPTGGSAYHLDGIIAYSGTTGGVVRPYIYNNYIHGDFANSSPTGFIFCTYGVPGSGSACTIFNNLLVGTGTTATGAQGIYFHSADGNPLGPHVIYNNTISGFGTGGIYTDGDSAQKYTVKNNIFLSNGGYYITLNGTPPANFVSDHNVFYGGRTFGGSTGGFPGGTSLSSWQSNGEDSHSVESNPNLDSAWHIQNSSSPAYGRGANLSLLNITPLNFSMPSVVGANGAVNGPARSLVAPSWDGGAYVYGVGASSSAPAAPQNLTAVAN